MTLDQIHDFERMSKRPTGHPHRNLGTFLHPKKAR